MFERFTERARMVVVLAQEESRRLGHDYVGTEHLLLGLLRDEEGVAVRTLNSLNVYLSAAYEQVESIVGHGDGRTGDQAPFTPGSKGALESALREALRLGHDYVGTEHILLGLVQNRESVAVGVLSNLGVEPGGVHRQILGTIDGQAIGVRPAGHSQALEHTRALRSELIRARVEGLLVYARCGVTDEERSLPQALRVDLWYAYRAGEGDELDETVDYGAVLGDVAELLEREEFRLLETGMRRAGARVLEGFPRIREVTIRVTKLHVPVARTVSGVSVEATFRR